MDFFDKLGKKASEAYKVTADKTVKIAKEAKLKMKMADLKSQANDIYEEIGKKVYEKHVREEELDIKKDLEEECTKLDVISDEIDSILKECIDLKDKKVCQNCHKEIEKTMNFCPECGTKQEEETSTEKANQLSDEQKEDVQENLEKTVTIESDIDMEKEQKEDENKEEG